MTHCVPKALPLLRFILPLEILKLSLHLDLILKLKHLICILQQRLIHLFRVYNILHTKGSLLLLRMNIQQLLNIRIVEIFTLNFLGQVGNLKFSFVH